MLSRTKALAVVAVWSWLQGAIVFGGSIGPPVLVADLATLEEGAPSELAIAGNLLLFAGPGDPGSHTIWRLGDGGPVEVADPCDSGVGEPGGFLPLPGSQVIYLTGGCSTGHTQLWRLDLATDLASPIVGAGSSPWDSAEGLWRIGARVVFRYQPSSLWVSDGTDAGTTLVRAFANHYGELAAAGGRLVFFAEDGDGGLWTTDGTPAGTGPLVDVGAAYLPLASQLFYRLGSREVFLGVTADEGEEIWVTDATTLGTMRLTSLRPGTTPSQVANLVVCRNVAYFRSIGTGPGGSEIGQELWRTDGTIGGTGLAVDLVPGGGSSDPRPIGCLGSLVVLVAMDAGGVDHLWISDGTFGGTIQIRTFESSWIPAPSLEFRGHLFFVAGLGGDGAELWVTDGTPAGTYKTGEIAPGLLGSEPRELTLLGNTIYFTADDGTVGRELWKLTVEPDLIFVNGFESGLPTAWSEP